MCHCNTNIDLVKPVIKDKLHIYLEELEVVRRGTDNEYYPFINREHMKDEYDFWFKYNFGYAPIKVKVDHPDAFIITPILP